MLLSCLWQSLPGWGRQEIGSRRSQEYFSVTQAKRASVGTAYLSPGTHGSFPCGFSENCWIGCHSVHQLSHYVCILCYDLIWISFIDELAHITIELELLDDNSKPMPEKLSYEEQNFKFRWKLQFPYMNNVSQTMKNHSRTHNPDWVLSMNDFYTYISWRTPTLCNLIKGPFRLFQYCGLRALLNDKQLILFTCQRRSRMDSSLPTTA